ncbi:glutathione S-transferase [Burkholderia sp. WAC0059]|uniref:glutathione S-transferase family protein n=1 Tax=Burkholderia sp. WAC0059 TaxID=2066022 RepID=UPI000C7F671A|nr:glutathione S-transferase family protein [Burkholderia sp. WAC0059]PLZ02963.1 glutathione S-transferase [Burkholderia sp. WAC0059]
MKLYGRRSSINVQKVLWCLAELGRVEGRDFERIDAGLAFGVIDTPEYRRLNPNGLVPTLVDGDFVLWESNSIARYLATAYGDGALLPADARARADVERWMDWQLGTLWATLRVAFLGLTRTPEAQRDYRAIAGSYDGASRLLSIADGVLQGQPYLAGDRFTLADLVVALCVHRWIDLGDRFADRVGERETLPALADWYGRATARPAFEVVLRP